MRAFTVIVVAGVAALALTHYAGWDDTEAREPDESTAGSPTTAPAELVRAAAATARPVETVLCQRMSEDMAICVVTFVGPSCQLWQVVDGKPEGLPLVVDGTGSRSATGVRCGG